MIDEPANKKFIEISNEPISTRSLVKNFNIPLQGDPNWGLIGQGLLNNNFKWRTKKFF